ncbi:hypothetical protein GCM10007047_02930 [Cerasicoccus arenae]|uniref:Uncharacterized protein n=1 Tax=Cerasicoccus arenae TaxID=424488 RepID=A0A8J3GC25_9BACT|nr:hypothetical protein GCM10007047_02930 [Cerasicoccus arenae]
MYSLWGARYPLWQTDQIIRAIQRSQPPDQADNAYTKNMAQAHSILNSQRRRKNDRQLTLL